MATQNCRLVRGRMGCAPGLMVGAHPPLLSVGHLATDWRMVSWIQILTLSILCLIGFWSFHHNHKIWYYLLILTPNRAKVYASAGKWMFYRYGVLRSIFVRFWRTSEVEVCNYLLRSIFLNQLEKLEAAKAAWLVLLGLTGPYLALLGHTLPYWALLGLTGPY